ncbi:3-demethoxyubiquinol 3-hydroxylase, partial [Lecanoromycetidae sp. Uapishka_2]
MNAAKALRSLYRQSLHHPPILDFLLPSFTHSRQSYAPITTSSAPPKTEPTTKSLDSNTTSKRRRPLSKEQRKFLDSALRVNQAGELAATLIYTHQTPPITRQHPHLRPLMTHMYSQEAGHFSTFNALLAKHRIRPTAFYPIWTAAASILGWGTGLMGREAAMACTEAVETEIGGHYNGQVRVLLGWVREMEERGEEVGEELRDLVGTLKRIRDEELEHLDEAVGEGAKEARPYELLNRVVRSGCKGAIWISERV